MAADGVIEAYRVATSWTTWSVRGRCAGPGATCRPSSLRFVENHRVGT
jgi:hypothetical protein